MAFRTTTPRFDFSDSKGTEQGLAFLEENGYVVVAGVLSGEEVVQAKSLFWNYVEEQQPLIKRADASTWDDRVWGRLCDPGTGIFARGSVGQSDFQWFVRSRPAVQGVFARVWGTDKLLTSFDGCGAFRPWAYNSGWRTSAGWWHLDQNGLKKPEKCCVQGLVSMYDATPETGGLCVVPKSHSQFSEVTHRLADRKVLRNNFFDFVRIPDNEPVMQTQPEKLVTCKAGDLILWDSRTVHCNQPGYRSSAPRNQVSSETVVNAASKRPSSTPQEEKNQHTSKESTTRRHVLADIQKGLVALKPTVINVRTADGLLFQEQRGTTGSPLSKTFVGRVEDAEKKLDEQQQQQSQGKPLRTSNEVTELQTQHQDLLRLVSYVCMTPAAMATPSVLKSRVKAVQKGYTTSHWPHESAGPRFPSASYTPSRLVVQTLVDGGLPKGDLNKWVPQEVSSVGGA